MKCIKPGIIVSIYRAVFLQRRSRELLDNDELQVIKLQFKLLLIIVLLNFHGKIFLNVNVNYYINSNGSFTRSESDIAFAFAFCIHTTLAILIRFHFKDSVPYLILSEIDVAFACMFAWREQSSIINLFPFKRCRSLFAFACCERSIKISLAE